MEFLHCRNHFVHRRRKNVHLEFFAFLDYIRRFQLVGGKLLDVDLRTELGKQRFLSLLDTLKRRNKFHYKPRLNKFCPEISLAGACEKSGQFVLHLTNR